MLRKVTGLFHRDANSLLSSGLLALLLVSYVALIYVTVLVAGAFLLGDMLYPNFSPSWWLNLVALALIALTLLPVNRWLREHINDLVYAQHDNPYLLIAKVNHQLQTMTTPQFTLPILAETIASELQLPYVAIEATDADSPLHYASGEPPKGVHVSRVPIVYLSKPMGALLASARSASQLLSENDISLLSDVAHQLGTALRASQLTADLQAARERLVIAREEERRRIRNDLHDGLAPTLSSLQLQLGALYKLIRSNPDQAEAIARDLREDLPSATAEIRQLVYDLRPPMLDELGLVGAIKSFRFQGSQVSLEIHAPDPLPRVSAAVEVAVYRIASEALHNVVKHAQASACVIQIEAGDGHLRLSVTDNGTSLLQEYTGGVGVSSMKERAVEVGGALVIQPHTGGGTQVIAQFPIDA